MKTRPLYLLAIAGVLVWLGLAAPQSTSGQSPADFSPQVVALVNQLTAQNKQLVANQAAMDAQIAAIEESIRQARIYAARSGGSSK
jgi:hypothetical protein